MNHLRFNPISISLGKLESVDFRQLSHHRGKNRQVVIERFFRRDSGCDEAIEPHDREVVGLNPAGALIGNLALRLSFKDI